MHITVLIPTYRRSQDLKLCLEALKKQDEKPSEVLVTIRNTDDETWEFIKKFDQKPLNIQPIIIAEPGLLVALTTGFNVAQGDIIAITDDDAVPHANWLSQIKIYFESDQTIGGVGGKDFLYEEKTRLVEGSHSIVGRIQWFGNVIGNHHLGVGKAREVDVLKGVNSSYRRTALDGFSFDRRLRISGKNTHNELAIGVYLKKTGWKLIYDPKITVNHYPGKRFQMADRKEFNSQALTDSAYNQTLILLGSLSPIQQFIFMIWSILVGTRGRRGLIQCLRFLSVEGFLSLQNFIATVKGRWQSWRDWHQEKNELSINLEIKKSAKIDI